VTIGMFATAIKGEITIALLRPGVRGGQNAGSAARLARHESVISAAHHCFRQMKACSDGRSR
jgi:hypothetical protein